MIVCHTFCRKWCERIDLWSLDLGFIVTRFSKSETGPQWNSTEVLRVIAPTMPRKGRSRVTKQLLHRWAQCWSLSVANCIISWPGIAGLSVVVEIWKVTLPTPKHLSFLLSKQNVDFFFSIHKWYYCML